MKKLILILLVTFGCIFAACSDTTEMPKEEAPFITDLVHLVGQTNEDFKQIYNGPCRAKSSRLLTKGFLYADDINIEFEYYGKRVWDNTNSTKDLYDSNPFYDDLIIESISVNAYYDGAQIFNQDSLRKIFNTDEVITYDFLNEKLWQTPQTEQLDAENAIVPMGDNQYHLVVHDVYRCLYEYGEYIIEVDFFDINDTLTAQSATVYSADKTTEDGE